MANDMRDRLIALIKQAYTNCEDISCAECKHLSLVPGKFCIDELIADQLIANGAILPPCNIGDTVYDISDITEIYTLEVKKIGYEKLPDGTYLFSLNDGDIECEYSNFGKTLFTSYEQAKFAIAQKILLGKE